jgi:hypothetical protein
VKKKLIVKMTDRDTAEFLVAAKAFAKKLRDLINSKRKITESKTPS